MGGGGRPGLVTTTILEQVGVINILILCHFFYYYYYLSKKGSETKKRTEEEEVEKGDLGLPIGTVEQILSDLNQERCLVISQTRVNMLTGYTSGLFLCLLKL